MTQLAAFKAKYGKLYPEAVSSLAEEEAHTLTFYDFPATMHRYIRTTNALESLFSNIRQRTDQIDVFTTKMSYLKPRDYLPDVVGTLTTGKLLIAEVGME